MGALKNWIVKTLLAKWLKGLLDKLPLNGLKTIVGSLMVALGVLLQKFPTGPVAEGLRYLLDLLQTVGAPPIVDPDVKTMIAGAVLAILGIIHKVLKRLVSSDSPILKDTGWENIGG